MNKEMKSSDNPFCNACLENDCLCSLDDTCAFIDVYLKSKNDSNFLDNLKDNIKNDIFPSIRALSQANILEGFLLFGNLVFALDTRQKSLGKEYLDMKLKDLKNYFNRNNIALPLHSKIKD